MQWITKLNMTNSISFTTASKKVLKNEFLGNFFMALSIFFLMLYSFTPGMASTFFGPSGRGMYAVFLFAIIVFGWICSPRFSLDNAKPVNLLIVLILMIVFFNNNYNLKNGSLEQLAFLYTFFIISVFGAHSDIWHKHLLRLCIFFASFFLIMTYVEIINPTFFIFTIMPKFSDAYSAEKHMLLLRSGYVAGFSTNAGINVSLLFWGLASLFSLWLNAAKHNKKLIFFIIAFILTMLVTGKRGPTIFAVCSLIYAYFYSKAGNGAEKSIKFLFIILFVMLAFSIVCTYVPEVANTMNRISNKSNGDDMTSGRDVIWQQSLALFYSSPIIGTGWDSLKYLININAHNVYLQLLCEVGVFCAIIFYIFFILSFIHVNAAIKRIRSENRNVPSALIFSLIFQTYFLLYCFTGNPLYDAFAVFGYLMSCSIGEYYYYQNQQVKLIYLPNKGNV